MNEEWNNAHRSVDHYIQPYLLINELQDVSLGKSHTNLSFNLKRECTKCMLNTFCFYSTDYLWKGWDLIYSLSHLFYKPIPRFTRQIRS